MKKFLAMTLAIVMMCGCLIACGKGNSIVGTWELDIDKTFAGEEQSTIDLMKGMGYAMTFEFKEDGKCVMAMTMMGETETTEMDYEIKDNQIVIGGEATDFVIDGKTLTITAEGQAMVFNKK